MNLHRLLLLLCLCGCQNSPDCPYPGDNIAFRTRTLLSGDPVFCAEAFAQLPGTTTEPIEDWNPDACELTESGSGIDEVGDPYTFDAECNVDSHGGVDCQITFVWPTYGATCVFVAAN